MDLNAWHAHIRHIGVGDLQVTALHRGSNTVLNLSLWISEFDFEELRIVELTNDKIGWCRVSVRRFPTSPLISRTLSWNGCILMVPVPDFICVLRAFGVRYEEVQGPRAPGALSRRQVHRGRYMVGSWRVEMIERISDDGSAVLLLQFTSRYVKTFSAQLFPYPKFHRLEMYNGVVRLVATLGEREDIKDDVRVCVRMVPLPCVSYIRESLSSTGLD